jgi:hypothetical protein
MCPSIEAGAAAARFAAGVLEELLQEIEVRNANADPDIAKGQYIFVVSHAWTDGAMMYLVYATPPSDHTWGLARDTRQSLINPSPWNDRDNPALYYYLLDLEENWRGQHSRPPGEPDTIWWHGYPAENLIGRLADIPEEHRYTPPPADSSWIRRDELVAKAPRRYANPL